MKKNTAAPTTPRAVKSQQVKDRIYQAAIDLLHEYGYEYITVNNICKMANVSTGSFYHYYESKDALLSNFFLNAYNDFIAARRKDYEDPIENIIQFYCCYADFCQAQGLEFVRNFYTPFNRSLDMRLGMSPSGDFALPSMAETAEKLRRAIQEGLFPADTDANQVAEDLCSIEKGCIFEWCVSDGSFVIREMVHRLLSTYLQGLRAQ